MKPRPIFALLAATALYGCQTPGTAPGVGEATLIATELAAVPASDRVNVAPAIATEIGVRFRCPRDVTELGILRLLRVSFDTLLRPRVQPFTAGVVDRLRADANAACAITTE